MKNLWFAIGTVLLVTGLALAVPSPEALLEYMETAMGGFTDLVATLSIVHLHAGQPDIEQEVKLYLHQPDRLRLEYLAPEYLAGNISLVIGDRFWIYIAATDTWYEKDLSQLSPSQQPWSMFRALLKAVRSEYREYTFQVSQDGDFLLLSGVPTEEGAIYGKVELWIDPENWLPVRRKVYDVDGNLLADARFLKHSQVASGVWLPLRIEIYDDAEALVSVIEYREVRVDTGVSLELFLPPGGSDAGSD